MGRRERLGAGLGGRGARRASVGVDLIVQEVEAGRVRLEVAPLTGPLDRAGLDHGFRGNPACSGKASAFPSRSCSPARLPLTRRSPRAALAGACVLTWQELTQH